MNKGNKKNTLNKKYIPIFIIFICLTSTIGCLEGVNEVMNKPPEIIIIEPFEEDILLGYMNVSGIASDIDNNEEIQLVEIKVNKNGQWEKADGTNVWMFSLNTYNYPNEDHTIYARAWDGIDYSNVHSIKITIQNPIDKEYNSHKWAIFIAAANFPEDPNEKLGNGGLYLAENMSNFFIENLKYSTSNIKILFDDGWIRENSGFGKPVKKLQHRPHMYNISYGAALKENVINNLEQIIEESNKYDDSEVFIWIFNHGFGDYNKEITGGKLFERSAIFLWDGYFVDKELGDLLKPLSSKETCVIIDACYIGGFADKTILNLPTLPASFSGISQPGRVIISSTSKFRTGIAILQYGPLFSLLWFDGLKSGNADGFRQGLLKTGRLPRLAIQDGSVSVEEAFYYARYLLRTVDGLNEFRSQQPQINDQYPKKGLLRNVPGLILGDN